MAKSETPAPDVPAAAAARPSANRAAFYWPGFVAALLCGGLAVRAHWETLGYALVGFDTYLQIASARIESVGDFFDTFRERLTNGRIEAQFYRPLQNFSIAFDYAVNGLNPAGYHVHTLVVLGLTVFVVFAAAARVLGGGAAGGEPLGRVRRLLAPTIAALFFGLHPVLLNIVPTPCRRSELLLVGFLAGVIWLLPERGERDARRRLWLAGLLTLLAAAAKDIGVMACGLIFLHQLFMRWEGGVWPSAKRAALATGPAVLASVIYLVNRTLVLQGLGGYVKKEKHVSQTYFGNLLDFGRDLVGDVFAPFVFFAPPGSDWSSGGVGLLIAAIGTAIAIGVLCFCIGAGEVRARAGVLIVLGLAWNVPLAIVLGALNWYGSWYAGIPVVGVAFVLAGLTVLACDLWRDSIPERVFGAVCGALAVTVIATGLYATPLLTPYPEWQRASRILATGLEDLERRMPADPSGTLVDLDIRPYYEAPEPPRNRPQLGWVATIQPRGIEAYLEISRPELRVRSFYAEDYRTYRVPPGEVWIRCKYYGPVVPF